MPGTIVFRPIEANLQRDTQMIGKMDPYCMIISGHNKVKGEVCKEGGSHPHWNQSIVLQVTDQPKCLVAVRDENVLVDDNIGECEMDLCEIEKQGKVTKWLPLHHHNKPVGELLIEASFSPEGTGSFQQGTSYGISGQQGFSGQQGKPFQSSMTSGYQSGTTSGYSGASQPSSGFMGSGQPSGEYQSKFQSSDTKKSESYQSKSEQMSKEYDPNIYHPKSELHFVEGNQPIPMGMGGTGQQQQGGFQSGQSGFQSGQSEFQSKQGFQSGDPNFPQQRKY